MAKKILIAGDSFAAKWNGSYPGWPDLLAMKYDVTNIAQAGVSEYKILKQIEPYRYKYYDFVIVSHTSPFRVHTPNHPIKREGLHKDCDLIYSDLENNDNKDNESLTTAINWFKHHYDEDYQKDIYRLMRTEIDRQTVGQIALDHFADSKEFAKEAYRLDFSNYWPKHRGNVNHYTADGNIHVFKTIVDKIEELSV